MEYRIEQKFLCNQRDYFLIKSRIERLMEPDQYGGDGNEYLIRSIYFDDINHSCFQDNEIGIDQRSKYRIRSYNHRKSYIRLERKDKINGYTHKESCGLDIEEYENLISQDNNFEVSDKKLLNELNYKRNIIGMRPSAIVEYSREAYVFEPGNVRITFDTNITVSGDLESFFEEDMLTIPVLEGNQFILEVKYDEFLHQSIASAVDLKGLQQTAFSKFYMGKKKLGKIEGGY